MTSTRRDLLSVACALTATTLLPLHSLAQAAPSADSPRNPIDFVNPELRAPLQQLLQTMGDMPDFNAAKLPGLRQMAAQWAAPLLPSPPVREKMIPGPSGSPQIKIYLVGDKPGASRPAVLHIHGGGYVSGSAATDRRNLQQMVLSHDCVVVSVEYRLAPETKFPGSLEDNYAALKWLYANADSLGVDRTRIAVKGESAGGGHAAALAIASRDRGEFPLCLQVLIYPMLDDRTGSTNRLPPQFGHYIWTEADNRFGWTSLLGLQAGSAKVPKGSVPARAVQLAGLAPAFIGVGSIDLFAPENIDYARRLLLAGVATELNVVPGAFHGFDGIVPAAVVSSNFTQSWNNALKNAFAVV